MSQILRLSDQVFFQEIDGEGIAMDVASGEYFKMNSTGVRIWNLIDGASTPPRIVASLAETFAVEPAFIHQEVIDFLQVLQEKGMVISLSGGTPSIDVRGL